MIIKNAIRCNICGDKIESKHRHDYVECSCGACAVDGGHNYLRRCAKDESCFTDISIIEQNKQFQEYVIFIGFSLSVAVALFLPPQPILVQNGGMWLGHDRVARKLLTRATAGDSLLQNAVAGVAVPFRMLVHTAFTAAFYVGRTTATVKAAFAQ